MELTQRQNDLLKHLVEEYIRVGKPVSSTCLSNKFDSISSATIRNELVILEKSNFVDKKFNVSGRIPTPIGYRYYIENIMDENKQSYEIKEKLLRILNNRVQSIDQIINASCNAISNMANIVILNNTIDESNQYLKKIDFINLSDNYGLLLIITNSGKVFKKQFLISSDIKPSDWQECINFFNIYLVDKKLGNLNNELSYLKVIGKTFILEHEHVIAKLVSLIISNIHPYHSMTGLLNVVDRDEYHDYNKFRKLIDLLDEKSIWKMLESENLKKGINLKIGKDLSKELEDVAAITKSYETKSGKKGQLAFIGPQRLEYKDLYGLLDWFIKKLERL